MEPQYHGLNELREMFLSFFESKGHLRLPSFSLIPQNDSSLLLINSGMAPMKAWFTGEQEPPCRRVCTCQKCVRTGDIDSIGKTSRHGTYFEMLGNFSFGDYFKREAIAWCWEFLTSPDWVGLDPDRLYPTVFLDDDEAFAIWRDEIGIPEKRIFHFGKENNFWEHGSGPCGPCSEVFYDRGEQWGCGKPDCTVGCDCDRYIEVWNNVFSQYDNDGEGHYSDLKQKNIDTGMGLERLACICQDVPSLFDVDTVMRITNKVSEITSARYGESDKTDVSLRVITDHIRSATFMICDGVLPSNEGRGYVLRRLLRRAARHGKLLGVDDPFLFQVCDTVIQENEGPYPELRERQSYITRIIRVEEENFSKTIDAGLKIFNDMVSGCQARGETMFPGEDAFKLYDTYGFPIDLTEEMVQERNMTVDLDEFQRQMDAQRARARKAREALGDLGWAGVEFGKDVPETEFDGYTRSSVDDAKVVALVVENEPAEAVMPGVEAIVVLDKTPFYAEMGGQVGDHGTLTADGMTFLVTDTQKNKGGKYMHYGVLTEGTLKTGDIVTASIDTERRMAIARAHTATHLLQKALQQVLGEHVHQAGSLVDCDFLHFDFTHFSSMTDEEIREVERAVNQAVLAGYPVMTEELPIEQARQKGAMALFGEKYGDVVRVVDMGGYSLEFCGGTHLPSTSMVGSFRINGEFSVASGVRRIEAVVGLKALDSMDRDRQTLLDAAALLKTNPAELLPRIQGQADDLRALRQQAEKNTAREAGGEADRLLAGSHDIDGLHVLTASIPDAGTDRLRQLGDLLRDRDPATVAVLASVRDKKITFLAVCGKDAVNRGVKAGDIIRDVCSVAGGSGGGKSDSAMGGGKDVTKVDDALAAVEGIVSEKIG